jgi:DNA-binding Xre family transcriptional regulator
MFIALLTSFKGDYESSMIRLKIKEIAEAKGLNRSQLQIKSGVTLPLLNRYWNNRTQSVTLDALERIARALDVEPGDLLVVEKESLSKRRI